MIGKLKRVPLREVWKHEALDFTTWMLDNVEVVGDIINLNLSNAEREKSAGSFNVDLVAEDDMGGLVIIENQLDKSNHDHLGKLITYLTSLEAKTAIWIVADPRPEHVRAISWLNESSAASFYLLKVEAIRIGDSQPAPLLTLIVGPSEEARELGDKKKQMAERYIIRKKFWTQLLDQSKNMTKLHSNISPSEHNWIGTSAGKRGLGLNYTVTQNNSTVELYIDRGRESEEENKIIFEELFKEKENIENVFGKALEWQSLEGKRACRIKGVVDGGYRDEEEKWPEIHKNMIETMIKLNKALKPYIPKLKILL